MSSKYTTTSSAMYEIKVTRRILVLTLHTTALISDCSLPSRYSRLSALTQLFSTNLLVLVFLSLNRPHSTQFSTVFFRNAASHSIARNARHRIALFPPFSSRFYDRLSAQLFHAFHGFSFHVSQRNRNAMKMGGG